ncbi:ubiquitin-conjugating enzyme/RWD-like protein [Lipomyces tetrasporus]|uniref:Ubiquitin-conjugating enzyme/RWD-like protein n=1 Tax=Lipomyces tetrasporus TaxID=54092 RepID=A0AAD7QLZ0_9ASCO|nr:ubiquitin-conjugating enzyme/RWD-like protein [Lipomyces tetrasporus]KAJ8097604.1 ubiquitin-conjugating enzyme/RWD-like protein [Lipomyces tetrasporus]
MATKPSETILRRQLREISRNGIPGISAGLLEDNIYQWEVLLIGPDDTLYEGGFFKARLSFPEDYPLQPPKMRFETAMWHPNGMNPRLTVSIVYQDGNVCISILHPPGEDKYGYEDAGERWLPVHSPETILLSVIAMLSSPNPDSPANIDAARELREDYPAFKKRVRKLVRESAEAL